MTETVSREEKAWALADRKIEMYRDLLKLPGQDLGECRRQIDRWLDYRLMFGPDDVAVPL